MSRAVVALALASGAALIGCASGASPRAADPVAVYPVPRFLGQDRVALPVVTACVDDRALGEHARLDAELPSRLAAVGLRAPRPGEPCQLMMTIATSPPSLAAWPQSAWDASPVGQRYAVEIALAVGVARAHVWAESERAARWAVAAALALVDDQRRVHGGLVVDGPAVPLRGLIEGYYGTPFTPSQRRCLLEQMEELRQNFYLYGPKDDPFARLRWADPYPSDAAAALAGAAAVARARDIELAWSVSPGLPYGFPSPGASISYASAADFARLVAKIDSVRALGITRFALFLDDTERALAWDADRAAYASLAEAHADLANRLDAYLRALGAPPLLLVGNFYTTLWDGWRGYVTTLGARLSPDIAVLWTGPQVYSASIAPVDLAEVNALLGRHVVLWDNQPDFTLSGRAPDLGPSLSGFLSNTVAIEFGWDFGTLSSMLGMIGDDQWSLAGYDADASTARWTLPSCVAAAALDGAVARSR